MIRYCDLCSKPVEKYKQYCEEHRQALVESRKLLRPAKPRKSKTTPERLAELQREADELNQKYRTETEK